jgi:hypothetical protein
VKGKEVTQTSKGGPQEGIKVHGHWIIEVRNPDGSLAERREFDNALTQSGRNLLLSYLGRFWSVGGWAIVLGSGTANSGPFNGPAPCIGDASAAGFPALCGVSGDNTRGVIAESTYPSTSANVFKTLTIDVPTIGANAFKLVLSGAATAQQNGTIGFVQTAANQLFNQPPSASYPAGGGGLGFTLAVFAPVTLTTGQQVQVTVIISFS